MPLSSRLPLTDCQTSRGVDDPPVLDFPIVGIAGKISHCQLEILFGRKPDLFSGAQGVLVFLQALQLA